MLAAVRTNYVSEDRQAGEERNHEQMLLLQLITFIVLCSFASFLPTPLTPRFQTKTHPKPRFTTITLIGNHHHQHVIA